MSNPASHRRALGESSSEFGTSATGEYQLTELKNVATTRPASSNAIDFLIRLVHAVREHPAFYDSGDVHFGNRHIDAAHRASAWQQVCRTLGYTGDVHALSQQWRKLKERYTRDRRKGGVSAGEEPLDGRLMAELSWLDEYVLERMPAPSTSSTAAVVPVETRGGGGGAGETSGQMYYTMEGEEDLLGDDFVVHDDEYGVDSGAPGASPARSSHSGTGSDIDVGGVGPSSVVGSTPLLLGKEMTGGRHHLDGSTAGPSRPMTMQPARIAVPSGSHATTQPSYRFVAAPSSTGAPHAQPHHAESITVSSRTNGATLIAHPKREGSVSGGGSTLTMVIDPTTYYQNGNQKMYRLVNVADLDQSQHATLQHLRPAGGATTTTLIAEPDNRGMGMTIARGSRKRLAPPLSPPSHAGAGGILAVPSSVDHSSPYGKGGTGGGGGGGQLGDELILDDGIVGENTIVIDHEREDESPLLADSPSMHHMMMGGSGGRGMHRGQHSPTLLANGSNVRGGSGGFSPNSAMRMAATSNPFSTSQYDADLALQHFISTHLARMNEDDKSVAKLHIQRILLDARFGQGTTVRMCMGDEEAELADAAVASEMGTGE